MVGDLRRETYLNMADEASADGFRRADFDAEAMAIADEYAREQGLPRFDVLGDLDVALEYVAAAERREESRR